MFSFACDKTEKKLLLIKTAEKNSTAVKLRIDKTSLTANNKFYISFGEKAPFKFFDCYPVNAKDSQLVGVDGVGQKEDSSSLAETNLVHPPVWGLCTVVETNVDEIKMGTQYRAMLPIANEVSFANVTVDEQDNMVVIRPTTNPAYNVFVKIPSESICFSSNSSNDDNTTSTKSDLALVTFPGIITGFGLYHALSRKQFYRSKENDERVVVLSSASSKVALALALYLQKHNKEATTTGGTSVKVFGYTSDQNKEFCQKTGLYDEILSYDEDLPGGDDCKYILIDIAGRGDLYKRNADTIKKTLVIGNASSQDDKDSTFACFSMYAMVKLMLTMAGAPSFLRKWMNPSMELFLIMDVSAELTAEWGQEKFNAMVEQATIDFVKAASEWMTVCHCNTDALITKAFDDIMAGTIPPSDAIIVDVAKAVADK